MFDDIFPMMASHAIELDRMAEDIARRIRINGTENQTFTIDAPSFSVTADDLRYLEQRVERLI